MLAVIMKIVSILGIVLLVLLCILLTVLLIVLFIPVVYRLDAGKDDKSVHADFKLCWLFGLLRAGYSYPEPGRIIVKILWFTVFDSGKKTEKAGTTEAEEKNPSVGAETKDNESRKIEAQNTDTQNIDAQGGDDSQRQELSGKACTAESNPEKTSGQEAYESSSVHTEFTANGKKTLWEKLFAKYEKIKYTIINIYDKIKNIFENISFYKRLLQDEETRLLFSHVLERTEKIIRHIRPRRIEADVIFGTGSPDTTGYAYAVYGMLSPHLGKDVCVTPDFTKAVLEGHLHAAGHIVAVTLLIHLLAVLLDRRRRLFIRRIKAHSDKGMPDADSKTITT